MSTGGPAAADREAPSCRIRVVVTDPPALDEARAVLTGDLAAVDPACSRFRDDRNPPPSRQPPDARR